jgi:hypothetical protein
MATIHYELIATPSISDAEFIMSVEQYCAEHRSRDMLLIVHYLQCVYGLDILDFENVEDMMEAAESIEQQNEFA